MKRVLICTIMRNQRANVDTWLAQLCELVGHVRHEWEVEVSVYENDSTDGTYHYLVDRTAEVTLRGSIPYLAGSITMSSDTLGTIHYPSIWSVDRIRNLAAARQKCLDQMADLSRFDKVVYVEPDVTYDPRWCSELILARHPHAAGLGEPDIYSGWSLRSETNPKESTFLYDTCATRATKGDVVWDIGENGGKWRGESLVRTDLGGVDSNCLHRVWSTFNCFCVYNAAYFAEGGQWGWVNTRLNTGQAYIDDGDHGSGWLDADTSVMCERFRSREYNNVFLNTNCLVRHL